MRRYVGVVVHRPLSNVPENTLKFAVGTLLSMFGTAETLCGRGTRPVEYRRAR